MVADSTLDAQSKIELTAAMDDYLVAFDRYSDRVILGNDVAGGKGKFRDIAHHLEDLLRKHYVPNLEKDILTLRRYEKDYLLRGDKGYVEKALSAIPNILDNISESGIPNQEKESLRGEIRAYKEDFLALVHQNERIIELAARMRHAVEQIEPLVSSMTQEATISMEQTSAATRKSSEETVIAALSLSSTAIILAIIFSVFLARHITRPVLTLVGLAELVAGNGDESEKERRKDEIAVLASAMGRMAGSHEKMLINLSEHTDNLESLSRDLDALAGNLKEPTPAHDIDLTVKEKTGRDIGALSVVTERLTKELTEIIKGLRKLMDHHAVW